MLRPRLRVGDELQVRLWVTSTSSVEQPGKNVERLSGTFVADVLATVIGAGSERLTIRERLKSASTHGDAALWAHLAPDKVERLSVDTEFGSDGGLLRRQVDGVDDPIARVALDDLLPVLNFNYATPRPIAIGETWTRWARSSPGLQSATARLEAQRLVACGARRRCLVVVARVTQPLSFGMPDGTQAVGTSNSETKFLVDVETSRLVCRTEDTFVIFELDGGVRSTTQLRTIVTVQNPADRPRGTMGTITSHRGCDDSLARMKTNATMPIADSGFMW
jgi:hypothetical protein